MAGVLTNRRTVPPRLKRIFWVVGGILGSVLSLMVLVSLFLNARAVHEARQMTTLDPRFHPPASAISCRSQVTSACTQEAARRSGLPVAWMAVPSGYRLQWVMGAGGPNVEKSHRIAEEMLTGGRVDLELDTQPPGPWEPWNEQQVGTYVENGTTFVAYRDRPQPDTMRFPAIYVRWMREGVQYQLWIAPHYLLDTAPIDPAAYAPILASIRYAGPPRPSHA